MRKLVVSGLVLSMLITSCGKEEALTFEEQMEITKEKFEIKSIEIKNKTTGKSNSSSKSNERIVTINGEEFTVNHIESNWDDDDGDNMRVVEDVFEFQNDEVWIKARIQVLGNTDTNGIEHLFVVMYDKAQGQDAQLELSRFNVEGEFNNGEYTFEEQTIN